MQGKTPAHECTRQAKGLPKAECSSGPGCLKTPCKALTAGGPLGPLREPAVSVSFPWGLKKTSASPRRELSFKRTNNSSTVFESGSSLSLETAATEGGRLAFTKKEGGMAKLGILKKPSTLNLVILEVSKRKTDSDVKESPKED